MKNKNLGFIFLILGSIIGAGFASGKEIETFFSNSKILSIFMVILASIFLFFLLKNLIYFAKITQKSNIKRVNKILFKNHSKFFDLFIFAGLFIFLTTFIAGINSIGSLIFENINFPMLSIISIFFAIFIVLNGFDSIKKLNVILMPIVIFFILFVSIYSIFNGDLALNSQNFTTNFTFVDIIKYLTLALSYISYNIVFSCSIILENGKNFSKKQSKINSFVISLIFFVLIFCVNFAILLLNKSYDMPLLILALKINKTVGYLFSIILWFSVLTSLISSLYVLTNSLKTNKYLSCCVLLTLAFAFSFFGFSQIVNIVYPLEGVICMIFVIKIFIYNKKYKNSMSKNSQKSLKIVNKF